MNIIKSNGYMITFPIMWLIIAANDLAHGKTGEALLDAGLALVILLIPPILDWIRANAEKSEDNPFERLAESVDTLKQTFRDEVLKVADRLAKIIGGSK